MLLLALLMASAVEAQDDDADPSELAEDVVRFAVVVHVDNPLESLEAEKIARMFLGRTSRWPDWEDGPAVVPIDQVKESRVRAIFSEEIHGKDVDKIIKWWYRQIYSGRGKPPDEVADDSEVLQRVAESEGGIGYVDASSLPAEGVRELTVIP